MPPRLGSASRQHSQQFGAVDCLGYAARRDVTWGDGAWAPRARRVAVLAAPGGSHIGEEAFGNSELGFFYTLV